jgi:hypothetical protein
MKIKVFWDIMPYWLVVIDVLKECSALIRVNQWKKSSVLELLDLEDEGTVFLWNVSNYVVTDMA